MPAAVQFDESDDPRRLVSDPLLGMPKITCSPLIGHVTSEEYEIQFADVVDDQIVASAAGSPIDVASSEVASKRL
jgi:D-3-phosphoglycerate dehydrogenase